MSLLQESTCLSKNSGEALQANMNKNRDLLSQLDAKPALAIEQERLSKVQRLQELENLIAAKEATMRKLKKTLSNANGFEGKGLTVEQKTVKYVLWKTNCFSTW
jgi:chemotaxis protein MotB